MATRQRAKRPPRGGPPRQRSRFGIVMERLLVIAILLLALPFMCIGFPLAGLAHRRRVKRFMREHDGHPILVWHSRRGWHDFCMNNLLPTLPEGVLTVHDTYPFWALPEQALRREVEHRAGTPQPARPYLLYISGRTVRTLSLNQPLQASKRRGKRDPTVQVEVAQTVQCAIDGLVQI
jgi:hypothetical protein